jgi:hypothetical protein
MASGLDLSSLPGNFQHSIACTRRLGYDYLWFDSLCILQHDILNWRHEVGRMAGYYNSAVVTLATADAINCHIGFLHRRRKDYSPPIRCHDGKFHYFREAPRNYRSRKHVPPTRIWRAYIAGLLGHGLFRGTTGEESSPSSRNRINIAHTLPPKRRGI